MSDKHYLDVPLTFNSDDQQVVGGIKIEDFVAQLLAHPNLYTFEPTFVRDHGELKLVEVSIVPVRKAREAM